MPPHKPAALPPKSDLLRAAILAKLTADFGFSHSTGMPATDQAVRYGISAKMLAVDHNIEATAEQVANAIAAFCHQVLPGQPTIHQFACQSLVDQTIGSEVFTFTYYL